MKTISIAKMQEFDRRAIEEYAIPSIILMENAGLRAADFIVKRLYKPLRKEKVVIVCGWGKNGGDGFVAARHLLNRGFSVSVFILSKREDIAGDSLVNLKILERMHSEIYFTPLEIPIQPSSRHNDSETKSSYCLDSKASLQKRFWRFLSLTGFTNTQLPNSCFKQKVNNCALIVDAIFGTGLKREVSEPVKSYIDYMNDSKKPIVALDIPSGLDGDTGRVCGAAVRAKYTVTFAFAKKGFFVNDGPDYTGRLCVVDISIPNSITNRKRVIG